MTSTPAIDTWTAEDGYALPTHHPTRRHTGHWLLVADTGTALIANESPRIECVDPDPEAFAGELLDALEDMTVPGAYRLTLALWLDGLPRMAPHPNSSSAAAREAQLGKSLGLPTLGLPELHAVGLQLASVLQPPSIDSRGLGQGCRWCGASPGGPAPRWRWLTSASNIHWLCGRASCAGAVDDLVAKGRLP